MLVPFQSMKQGTMISLDSLGAKGIFVGIITAIITTEIYCKICAANITIKMPKSVPPMIADSFIVIIPGAVPLLLANTMRCIFTYTNYKCDQLHLQSSPAAFDGSWRNVAGRNPRRLPYAVVLAVRYPRHIARQLSHIIPPKCQNNGLLLRTGSTAQMRIPPDSSVIFKVQGSALKS